MSSSSLLGSIFGTITNNDNDNDVKLDDAGTDERNQTRISIINSSLFDNSKSLPDRPQHKPINLVKRTKHEENKELGSSDLDKNDAAVENKKKKKRRISKSNREGKEEEPTLKAAKTLKDGEQDDKISIDDTNNEEERTIFVGNLPLATTTRKSLSVLFKDCGPIVSTRIRSVPVRGIKLPQKYAGDQKLMKKVCVNTNQIDDSLTNTVQGYVVFKSVHSVTKALEKNKTTIVDGIRIRVDRATPTVDPSRSVFVGNLPYGADESSLHDHFAKGCLLDVGDIQNVRIVRDKETFQCKGFGYVLFREKSMIPTALKLHESTYMNKPIRVLVCGRRNKGKKGEQAKPKYLASQDKEKVTVGAFRRIISKQQKGAIQTNKRKRGEKKKASVVKGKSGLSKRAAIDKKVEKKVQKLQKRMSKGMGKSKRR